MNNYEHYKEVIMRIVAGVCAANAVYCDENPIREIAENKLPKDSDEEDYIYIIDDNRDHFISLLKWMNSEYIGLEPGDICMNKESRNIMVYLGFNGGKHLFSTKLEDTLNKDPESVIAGDPIDYAFVARPNDTKETCHSDYIPL